MTRQEVLALLDDIGNVYPAFRFRHEPLEQQKKILDSWERRLTKCDGTHVVKRLDQYVADGNKFPPSVAEVFVGPDPFGEDYRKKQAERFAALEHERTEEEVEEIERIKREAFRQLIAQRQRG